MDLSSIKDAVSDLITDHWLKAVGGVAMLLVGRYWGRRRARRDWARREFLHRLMISLNSLGEEGDRKTLRIRTILEKDIHSVLLNSVAVDKVLKAAERTTAADPILPLAPDDRWLLLNSVLNEIAEQFSAGTLAADLGLPVTRRRYVLCLTHEVAGPVKTRKIRAMMARRDLLEGGAFEGDVALESESHSTRLDTLRAMRRALAERPDLFLEVELALPSR